MGIQRRIFLAASMLAAFALLSCGRVEGNVWTWQRRDCVDSALASGEEVTSTELSMKLVITDHDAVLEQRAAACEVDIVNIAVGSGGDSTYLDYANATATCSPAGCQARYEEHFKDISADAADFGPAPVDQATQAGLVQCPADPNDPATSTAAFQHRFVTSISNGQLAVTRNGLLASQSCTDYYTRE